MDLTPAFEGLNDRERIYVESRLRGMTRPASAAAAGLSGTKDSADRIDERPHVKAALEAGRQISIQSTGMTREKITQMFLDAHNSATTAAEQIMAIKEIAKLHGLYEAVKVNVNHNHKLEAVKSEKDMRSLPTSELLKLAQMRGGDFIEGEFQELGVPQLIHGG